MTRAVLLFFFILTLISPHQVAGHVIPTVTHTITVKPGENESSVLITYYYDPIVVSRFIRDFDQNGDRTISDSEKKVWGDKHLDKVSFSVDDETIELLDKKLTIPAIDGLINEGSPVEVTGTLPVGFNCKEVKKLRIIDHDAFMSVEDDIYSFVIDKKGCISVNNGKSSLNEAVMYIGKSLKDKEKNILGGSLTTDSQDKSNNAPKISEVTSILKDTKISGALFLWALVISFVLGGLHALTPGHGKTLVAAYLVGQHGTKKDAVILAAVTTATHTFSIYVLGLVSIFATKYFLPEKIIPALETISALSIFGLGIWLLSRRWDELKNKKSDSNTHSHGGIVQHSHGYDKLNSERLGVKSLISLGFSGGIVPCADALAIMIIAIGLNKTTLGMLLIFFFSLGLAAVLVVLGLVMVTSRNLFEKYAPSSRVSAYLPIASSVIIIIVGALLVLKTVKII